MRKCKCVNCGVESQNDIGSRFTDYLDNGFKPVWDVSDGMDTIVLCESCYDIVKTHVTAIESIIKTEIESFQFCRHEH